MRKTTLTVVAAMIVSATIAAVATWLIVDGDGETAVSDRAEPQEISAFESTVLQMGLAGPSTTDVVCRTTTGDIVVAGPIRTKIYSGNREIVFCGWKGTGHFTVPQLVESEGEWIAVSYVNGVEQKVRVNP